MRGVSSLSSFLQRETKIIVTTDGKKRKNHRRRIVNHN